jgi:hypothetical protein
MSAAGDLDVGGAGSGRGVADTTSTLFIVKDNGSVAKVRNMRFGGRAKRSKKAGRKRLLGRPKRI